MRSDYEIFESSSVENRRLLRQEELILEVTESLVEAMQRHNTTKAQLAERIGRSKAFVSQVLSGHRNLTLRTLADLADALGCAVSVKAKSVGGTIPLTSRETISYGDAIGGHARSWSPRVVSGKFGAAMGEGMAA